MDEWSTAQLRRLRLGGNARLRDFFDGYPGLCRGPAPKQDPLGVMQVRLTVTNSTPFPELF